MAGAVKPELAEEANKAVRMLVARTRMGEIDWVLAPERKQAGTFTQAVYTAEFNSPDWRVTLSCVDRSSPTLIVCDRWFPWKPWVFPNVPAIIELQDVIEDRLGVTAMAERFFAAVGIDAEFGGDAV